jgi:cytochrome c peroxidase
MKASTSIPFGLTLRVAFCLIGGVAWFAFHPQHAPAFLADKLGAFTGTNPHPVMLLRPPVAPLSTMAQLGKTLFYDKALSASGQQSCASCHSAAHGFGPDNSLAVQLGGIHSDRQGVRSPPSLGYLYRQPAFSIGPDLSGADAPPDLTNLAAQAANRPVAQKIAAGGDRSDTNGMIGTGANASANPTQPAPAMVPQGGLFWDGRVDSLQDQAAGPLLNPVEMANASVTDVERLLDTGPRHTPKAAAYHEQFVKLFGTGIFSNGNQAVSEALFAISRYEIEAPAFHPYSSKYDAWLEGKARLSAAEERGLHLFNDPAKANCAGCHLSAASKDGLPPMFTDYQYEALGVPRNDEIERNKDPHYDDMGLCGPFRQDTAKLSQYCGMFLTPTLRNVATRHVFFHNGKYHTLEDVLAFYNERDTNPGRFYPRGQDGKVDKFDDLPPAFRANVDVMDAPFNRHLGDKPAMTAQDIKDIIAFLGTLTDGYQLVRSAT